MTAPDPYKPTQAPVERGDMVVQNIRANPKKPSGHDVTYNGRTLRVLPDPHTTTKKRSWHISRGYDEASAANEALAAAGSDVTVDVLAYIAGSLLFAGADRLELDGVPLTPEPGAASVAVRVDFMTDGRVVIEDRQTG